MVVPKLLDDGKAIAAGKNKDVEAIAKTDYKYTYAEDATMEDVKMNVIQPFLDHVREVIANNNEQVYKYILVWIASVLQKPSFKTETALVILGHQGTGKSQTFRI